MKTTHKTAYGRTTSTRHLWPWMFLLLAIVLAAVYNRSITSRHMLLTENKAKYQCKPRTSVGRRDNVDPYDRYMIKLEATSESKRAYLEASYTISGDDYDKLLVESGDISRCLHDAMGATLQDKEFTTSSKATATDRFTEYVTKNMVVNPGELSDIFYYISNHSYGTKFGEKLFNRRDYMMNTIKNLSNYGALNMSGAKDRYFVEGKIYLDTSDTKGAKTLVRRVTELLIAIGARNITVTGSGASK